MSCVIKIPPIALHPGQQAIINGQSRYKVISAGRRFGKTLLSVEWLGLMPGGALDGAPVGYFAPTYKLLLDVWSNFSKTLKPVIQHSNKTEMRMELITGGLIDFWTLEDANAGRGRKYKRAVIDEAAHARYLKDAWEQAISPTLTDYRGDAWFVSTPKGINFFHELYQRGLSGQPGWASYHAPTSANPHIDPREIDAVRQTLPELVFRQEYLAEFVTFGAGLVKPEFLIQGTAPEGMPIALGVDLAISEKQGADYSAITAMSRDNNSGRVYIREVERFRGQFNEVLNRIKAAAARHHATVIEVEQTQYQAAVVQELARTTALPVRGVRPDKDKLTRFMPLLTRFEQGLVRYDPAHVPAWYLDELLSFPEGEHDDGVDSSALALHALSQIEYKPMDYSFTVPTSA